MQSRSSKICRSSAKDAVAKEATLSELAGRVVVPYLIIAGVLSEAARKQQWENRKAFNLFENFYRFGSFVFGGGDVLIPLIK